MLQLYLALTKTGMLFMSMILIIKSSETPSWTTHCLKAAENSYPQATILQSKKLTINTISSLEEKQKMKMRSLPQRKLSRPTSSGQWLTQSRTLPISQAILLLKTSQAGEVMKSSKLTTQCEEWKAPKINLLNQKDRHQLWQVKNTSTPTARYRDRDYYSTRNYKWFKQSSKRNTFIRIKNI